MRVRECVCARVPVFGWGGCLVGLVPGMGAKTSKRGPGSNLQKTIFEHKNNCLARQLGSSREGLGTSLETESVNTKGKIILLGEANGAGGTTATPAPPWPRPPTPSATRGVFRDLEYLVDDLVVHGRDVVPHHHPGAGGHGRWYIPPLCPNIFLCNNGGLLSNPPLTKIHSRLSSPVTHFLVP